MKKTMIEELLEGKAEQPSSKVTPPSAPALAAPQPVAPARAQEDDAEPDGYRPYVIRGPRPSFSVVEASGKRHGFAYHNLRHPKHEVHHGSEFLSFLSDGCEVIMQGKGLLTIYHGMLRHTLWEMRAHDGQQPHADEKQKGTAITRLEVVEPQERLKQMQAEGRA